MFATGRTPEGKEEIQAIWAYLQSLPAVERTGPVGNCRACRDWDPDAESFNQEEHIGGFLGSDPNPA